MFIIKNITTDCGESIHGSFTYINQRISIVLEERGSQLLTVVKNLIIKIVNNKPLKYTERLEKIFWRVIPLELETKRRLLVESILFQVKIAILFKLSS